MHTQTSCCAAESGADRWSPLRALWVGGALSSAFQPSRLIAGFVVALFLWLPGLGWDALVGPTVDASGLLGEPFDDAEQSEVQATLRRLAAEYAPDARFESARVPGRELAALIEAQAAAAPDAASRQSLLIAAARAASLAPLGSFQALLSAEARAAGMMVDGVLSASAPDIALGVRVALWDVPRALWNRDSVFAVVFALWCALVLTVGGGAIARMEAVNAAGKGALSARQGFAFAAQRWADLVLSWLAPVGIAALLGLLCVLWGLLFRMEWTGWLAGLLYGVPLAIGSVAGLAIFVWLLGAPLAPAAVACDGLDAMDASQRGALYALARPGAWLFRMAIVVVVAAAGLAIARVAAWIMTSFSGVFVSLGAGTAASTVEALQVSPDGGAASFTGPGVAVGWWIGAFSALVAGSFVSLVFGLLARAYLSLRELCDRQPTHDLWPFQIATDVTDPPTPDA